MNLKQISTLLANPTSSDPVVFSTKSAHIFTERCNQHIKLDCVLFLRETRGICDKQEWTVTRE